MSPLTISATIERLRQADPRAAQYAQDIMAGRIPACEKIKLAVRRCLRDLERDLQGRGRWTFDPELGSKPVRFMEKFMRPSGDYDKLELMGWQVFFEVNLFGWVARDSGERRFRIATLLVAGGNGKTPLIAGTAVYYVSQMGIRNCEVDVFANSKDQSGILLGDCESMIKSSSTLSRRFKCQVKGITYLSDGGVPRAALGTIKGFASDARKLDGIRPTAALIDEKHEMRNYRLINHAKRSLNKAKGNQLMVTISTMGYVLDGPLVDDYRRGDQILKGIYPEELADRELVLIYEMDADDKPDDFDAYIKANPSLGVLLELDDLITAYQTARFVPGMLADFLTKQLNIFTQTDAAGYLDFSILEANRDEIDAEQLRGLTAYGGLDMGASEDHCSTFAWVPMPDGRLFGLMHTWVPQAKVESDPNRLPYAAYEKMGYLTIVPGRYVQQQAIHDWFDEQSEKYGFEVIGGDPANATLLARALQSYRGENKPVYVWEPVRQGALTLNDPMKSLRQKFLDGLIVHNRNLLFEWYLNNVRLRRDYKDGGNENWVPVKGTAGDKIDGFMAGLNAYTVYLRRVQPCSDVEAAEPGIEFIQLTLI